MPVITKRVSTKKQFLHHPCPKIKKKRDSYKRLVAIHRDPFYEEQHRFYRNLNVRETKKSIRENVSKKICAAARSSNLSDRYKCLNGILNKKHNSTHITKLASTDGLVTDSQRISETLNTKFTGVARGFFPNPADSYEPPQVLVDYVSTRTGDANAGSGPGSSNYAKFEIPFISCAEVESAVKRLKGAVYSLGHFLPILGMI